jgi:hypothetical protein
MIYGNLRMRDYVVVRLHKITVEKTNGRDEKVMQKKASKTDKLMEGLKGKMKESIFPSYLST